MILLDFSTNLQKSFQDPATPLMEGIVDLHHHIFFFLIVILIIVVWLLCNILYFYNSSLLNKRMGNTSNNLLSYFISISLEKQKKFTHDYVIEIVWTVIPSIVLVFIALPSFTLLYSIDEIVNPELTFKVIGHQWYWSYEFDDYKNALQRFDVEFDSYMQPTEDLMTKDDNGAFYNLRLLEVDAPLYLPIRTHIRVIVTSADVLHSWAIPSLGVKCDAVPGRLNQVSLFIKRAGSYYGQCSEICGVNHGFMPIGIHAIAPAAFQQMYEYDNVY